MSPGGNESGSKTPAASVEVPPEIMDGAPILSPQSLRIRPDPFLLPTINSVVVVASPLDSTIVSACENGAPRIDPLLYRPRGDEPPGAHMSRATDAALRVESVRSSSAPPLRRPLEVRASR
mmetsp:Transcript_20054/g.35743  ORF Transcript_20054/g.35743 Transcript_20054/m.35743 type:complete len:121 (+) Transcript_20054:364-726(+)